jgi:hypothetical protein
MLPENPQHARRPMRKIPAESFAHLFRNENRSEANVPHEVPTGSQRSKIKNPDLLDSTVIT